MFFRIPNEHLFPDPRLAEPSGLLGVGGDLDPARLLLAYSHGIFPWYSQNEPILWWSPDPREVLWPDDLIVRRSLAKRVRQRRYRITMDQAFDQVVARCGEVPRRGQSGTWITDEMREGYRRLHQMGAAHSVEAWEGSDLVGGLYGVCVGSVFCGESMFALRPDASKVAFVTAMRHLQQHGLTLVDCQIETAHLRSLGAESLAREDYLGHLRAHLGHSLAPGAWSLPEDFEACPAKT